MPKLYEEWLDDVEKQIEADAREDAGDDDEVYLSILFVLFSFAF